MTKPIYVCLHVEENLVHIDVEEHRYIVAVSIRLQWRGLVLLNVARFANQCESAPRGGNLYECR